MKSSCASFRLPNRYYGHFKTSSLSTSALRTSISRLPKQNSGSGFQVLRREVPDSLMRPCPPSIRAPLRGSKLGSPHFCSVTAIPSFSEVKSGVLRGVRMSVAREWRKCLPGNNIAKYEPENWVVRGRERPRSFGPAAPARAALVAPAHVPCEDQRGSVRVLTPYEVDPRVEFEGENG